MNALRDACDRSYARAFTSLVPHIEHEVAECRSFGAAVAVVTGFPRSFFNPVIAIEPETDPQDVLAGVGWIRSRGVEASVQLGAELRARFEPALRDVGLEPDPWVLPGMALHPIPGSTGMRSALQVEQVTAETFEHWREGSVHATHFGRVYGPAMLEDPAFRFLVGYLGGEPVAGAVAIVGEGVTGIYAVWTAEHMRRRGFGQAVTWAAVQAGVDAGCDVAVLQSTEMAMPLYRRMGFVEVRRYVEFFPEERPLDGVALGADPIA